MRIKVRQTMHDNTSIDMVMNSEEYSKRKLIINTLKNSFLKQRVIEGIDSIKNENDKNLINDLLKVSNIEHLESNIFSHLDDENSTINIKNLEDTL